MSSFKEFKASVVPTRKGRKAKIRNSFGIYDVYKLIRKDKWYDIGRPLTEHEFYTIIREVNRLLAEELALGKSITFPYAMGKLELKKSQRGVSFTDGKLKINYPVDWLSTLQLWHNDGEAKADKTLIRHENKYVYKIKYDSTNATYKNKVFYKFVVNSFIKDNLSRNIQNGIADTLWEVNYNK